MEGKNRRQQPQEGSITLVPHASCHSDSVELVTITAEATLEPHHSQAPPGIQVTNIITATVHPDGTVEAPMSPNDSDVTHVSATACDPQPHGTPQSCLPTTTPAPGVSSKSQGGGLSQKHKLVVVKKCPHAKLRSATTMRKPLTALHAPVGRDTGRLTNTSPTSHSTTLLQSGAGASEGMAASPLKQGTRKVTGLALPCTPTTCSFCGRVVSAEDIFTSMSLEVPLPQSLLDPASLLQCLGVAPPEATSTTRKTVKLCQECNALVCEADVAYKHLLEVTAHMKRQWVSHRKGLPGSFQVVNTPLRPVNTKVIRKFRPILPRPKAPKEPVPSSAGAREESQRDRKNADSVGSLVTCGLCGADLHSEAAWYLHASSLHKLSHSWRSHRLQATLKALLVKELQHGGTRGRQRVRCPACLGEVPPKQQFVDHLRDHHSISVDEEFLTCVASNHEGQDADQEGQEREREQEQEQEEEDRNECLPVPDECHNYLASGPARASPVRGRGGKEGQWRCRVCAKVFSAQKEHDQHKASDHPDCVRARRGRVQVTSVQPPGRDVGQIACGLCGEMCENQQDLELHVDACHEDAIVILEGDGQGGVTQRRMQLSHTLDTPAAGSQNATAHRRPDGTRGFPCSSCGEVLGNRLQLVRHKRSVHQELGGADGLVMVECEVCGRRLHGLASLRHHQARVHHRSHRPPLRHRCRLCVFHCHTRTQLERHMRERHGMESFPPVRCAHCGNTYSAKYIQKHISNMHENQKKFSCSFCAMRFNVAASLRAHISQEHANNTWHCDVCHQQFSKYHQLRQHRLYVHSSVVHRCSKCPRTFKRKCDLTEHCKRRHQEKVPMECSLCPKVYTDRMKFRTHLMKKHSVPWEDTLAQRYARLQRENNCLQRRQSKSSRASRQEQHQQSQKEAAQQCIQLQEGSSVASFEDTVEEQQEYSVVHLTQPAHHHLPDTISYIILDEP